MHGPIFNYIISEIEYVDNRKHSIINRKLLYSDKDLNTNYRKMTYSSIDEYQHNKIHECIIYSDDFEYIKKIMFSLFEILEFNEGIIFSFCKLGNGDTRLSIFKKGYGYPIQRSSNVHLLYVIMTDYTKKNNQILPSSGNNKINYSEFDREFERQRQVAIEKEKLETFKKDFFEKERQLALKEQELKEQELRQKEFLLEEQRLFDLKKQELDALQLEQQQKAIQEQQLRIDLQRHELNLREKESLLLDKLSTGLSKESMRKPKMIVVKVSKKPYTKQLIPRKSPRFNKGI
jgi:hypothetical protein